MERFLGGCRATNIGSLLNARLIINLILLVCNNLVLVMLYLLRLILSDDLLRQIADDLSSG